VIIGVLHSKSIILPFKTTLKQDIIPLHMALDENQILFNKYKSIIRYYTNIRSLEEKDNIETTKKFIDDVLYLFKHRELPKSLKIN
jgi:hypothetical protein